MNVENILGRRAKSFTSLTVIDSNIENLQHQQLLSFTRRFSVGFIYVQYLSSDLLLSNISDINRFEQIELEICQTFSQSKIIFVKHSTTQPMTTYRFANKQCHPNEVT